MRAFVLNSCLIIPYEWIKEGMYNSFGDGYANKIVAVITASSVALLLVLPLDNMKTRI